MSDVNVLYCSLLLKEARKELKKQPKEIKAKFSHMTTWYTNSGLNRWYEVWNKQGVLLWHGTAFNANEAKANAIISYLENIDE